MAYQFAVSSEDIQEGKGGGFSTNFNYFKIKDGETKLVMFATGDEAGSVLTTFVHKPFVRNQDAWGKLPFKGAIACRKASHGEKCPICDAHWEAVGHYAKEMAELEETATAKEYKSEIDRLASRGLQNFKFVTNNGKEQARGYTPFNRSVKAYVQVFDIVTKEMSVWEMSGNQFKDFMKPLFDKGLMGDDNVFVLTRTGKGSDTKYSVRQAEESELVGIDVSALAELIEEVELVNDAGATPGAILTVPDKAKIEEYAEGFKKWMLFDDPEEENPEAGLVDTSTEEVEEEETNEDVGDVEGF